VKLEPIIQALERANDSVSSYLDVETGEVRSITEEEVDLAEDPQTVIEELPDWQREAVKLAWSIQEQEGKRYLTYLTSSTSTSGPSWIASPKHGKTHGCGMISMTAFAVQGPSAYSNAYLRNTTLWDAWNRFKQVELRQMAIHWCEENGIAFRQL